MYWNINIFALALSYPTAQPLVVLGNEIPTSVQFPPFGPGNFSTAHAPSL